MRWWVTVMALLLALDGRAAAPAVEQARFEFKFGVVVESPAGEVGFRETMHVPLEHGVASHGFVLTRLDGAPFNAYMVGRMPRTPGARGPGLLWDGNNFSTPARNYPGAWVFMAGFDPGDPEGLYVMEIYIDNKLFRRIEYRVYYP
ncbi:MAG: hypothetical protein GKR94_23885 [Gammaproteobacteria bacterium]|nr:hypothetical protein [Gammaproteobacteria bacterium]